MQGAALLAITAIAVNSSDRFTCCRILSSTMLARAGGSRGSHSAQTATQSLTWKKLMQTAMPSTALSDLES